jgi:PAS domain-containing protein
MQKLVLELEKLAAGNEKITQIAVGAQELTRSIINATRDPFVVMDADLKILSVNIPFTTLLKLSPRKR